MRSVRPKTAKASYSEAFVVCAGGVCAGTGFMSVGAWSRSEFRAEMVFAPERDEKNLSPDSRYSGEFGYL